MDHEAERFRWNRMNVEKKLEELGIKLVTPAKPMAAYVPAVRIGDLVFTSGHGPNVPGRGEYRGKVGSDFTVEQGYEAAKNCAINCLAAAKLLLGDLDKVDRVVKLLGFVNSADGFNQQPKVVNGASELLQAVFREKGAHARSAVGMKELPGDIAVEIEMILGVKD
jgi:enamine deaminase RidA (YjgF/YER057c/UK114 family)